MTVCATLFGIFLIVSSLWEGFETIVLPRSVNRPIRLTRQFYQVSWPLWRKQGARIEDGGRRQQWLGIYGPLSLPILLGLWAFLLVVGFALVQWAQGNGLNTGGHRVPFDIAVYQSGVTFFTLGYGDVVPVTGLARAVSVIECGVGLGFLALVIGYLPVLYQAFSKREATISRLDARASSPASAGEMLRRYGKAGALRGLDMYLRDWEQWASEILESHLSYPVLTFYRSQHEHQSWLGALMTIMDICTLIIVGIEDNPIWGPDLTWQAQMTFAMGRHAIIDLAYTFNAHPQAPDPDRLPDETLSRLRAQMTATGLVLHDSPEANEKLSYLRGLYEPHFCSLAAYLAFPLPPWLHDVETPDNWQTSAWDHTMPHF